MLVSDILKVKGPEVFTIGKEKTVADALAVLVINKIGALLVLDDNARIVGIVSERDVLRFAYEKPQDFTTLKIQDIMTKDVIVVEKGDELEYVESIMTNNRIRHLPVVHNKVLVGIISIKDLVKALLKDTRADNKYLFDYISGSVK